jgi:hypothetical protein
LKISIYPPNVESSTIVLQLYKKWEGSQKETPLKAAGNLEVNISVYDWV